jgi:hypothetical protein
VFEVIVRSMVLKAWASRELSDDHNRQARFSQARSPLPQQYRFAFFFSVFPYQYVVFFFFF